MTNLIIPKAHVGLDPYLDLDKIAASIEIQKKPLQEKQSESPPFSIQFLENGWVRRFYTIEKSSLDQILDLILANLYIIGSLFIILAFESGRNIIERLSSSEREASTIVPKKVHEDIDTSTFNSLYVRKLKKKITNLEKEKLRYIYKREEYSCLPFTPTIEKKTTKIEGKIKAINRELKQYYIDQERIQKQTTMIIPYKKLPKPLIEMIIANKIHLTQKDPSAVKVYQAIDEYECPQKMVAVTYSEDIPTFQAIVRKIVSFVAIIISCGFVFFNRSFDRFFTDSMDGKKRWIFHVRADAYEKTQKRIIEGSKKINRFIQVSPYWFKKRINKDIQLQKNNLNEIADLFEKQQAHIKERYSMTVIQKVLKNETIPFKNVDEEQEIIALKHELISLSKLLTQIKTLKRTIKQLQGAQKENKPQQNLLKNCLYEQ